MAGPRLSWPLERINTQGDFDEALYSAEVKKEADVEVNSINSGSSSEAQVIGSSDMFDENGNIRLIPMPTSDPKDPLNMSNFSKWAAVGVLCFFGSLSLSAEVVIGSLIPIFLLEYAGLDPTIIRDVDFVAASGGKGSQLDPFAVIPKGVAPPSLEKVTMLVTIPLITNGIASYLLVPLSIAIGRRPVLLLTAVLAWAGGFWAGVSTSLDSHLAGRAVMGLGAGAVQALIPLIVQDMMFVHQRNKAQSAIVASQGIIIIGLGIAAPYVSANYDWRYLYHATSGLGIVAWLMLCFMVPETRWTRSNELLAGKPEKKLEPGETRPRLDYATYGERTLWTNLGMFNMGYEWRNAAISMLDTLKTTIFPAMIWSILTNSIFGIITQAAQQISSFALLAEGWEFQWTGLSVVPFVLAAAMTFVIAGPVAENVTKAVAKRRHGVREAEYSLLNLVLPFLIGIAGCFIFGYAGQSDVHWSILLLGLFLLILSFLCSMITINVYVVESYPQFAGPVLVNVTSLRLIIGFFFSSVATTWVQQKGLLPTFVIYAETMIVLLVTMPVLFFYGKRLRQYTAGKIKATPKGDIDGQSRWSDSQ